MPLETLEIVVRGAHDTGKTTVASLIRMALEEAGFRFVRLEDVEPLPHDQKSRFPDRLERNRGRPVVVRVELVEDREKKAAIDPKKCPHRAGVRCADCNAFVAPGVSG